MKELGEYIKYSFILIIAPFAIVFFCIPPFLFYCILTFPLYCVLQMLFSTHGDPYKPNSVAFFFLFFLCPIASGIFFISANITFPNTFTAEIISANNNFEKEKEYIEKLIHEKYVPYNSMRENIAKKIK